MENSQNVVNASDLVEANMQTKHDDIATVVQNQSEASGTPNAIKDNQVNCLELGVQSSTIKLFEQRIKQLEEFISCNLKALHETLVQTQKLVEQNTKHQFQLEKQINISIRNTSESVWAAIFNNTIAQSSWLRDKTFSPGRWAVGYPFLYVMYRILDEVRPHKILEFGLGQSTRMLGQYASSFREIEHYVIEHDVEWIDFFSKNFQLSSYTTLFQLNWGKVDYHGAKDIRVYEGLNEKISDKNFDLIVIDGPFGGDMREYSRIDTLLMLPNCLSDNFIIILDDYNRQQEQHTLTEMENILKKSHIHYKKGVYSGQKDTAVLASKSLSFVCSM